MGSAGIAGDADRSQKFSFYGLCGVWFMVCGVVVCRRW